MAKKKKTYAEAAKSIMAKYKNRLGEDFDKKDKYALEAMNRELDQLKQKQEVLRDKKGLNDNQPNQIMEQGGVLPKKNGGGYSDFFDGINLDLNTESIPVKGFSEVGNPIGDDHFKATGANINNTLDPKLGGDTLKGGKNGSGNEFSLFESDNTASYVGAGASLAGNIANYFMDDPKPEKVKPSKYTPEEVDFSGQRGASRSRAAQSKREAMRRARNIGSGIDYINNSLAAGISVDRDLGDQIMQSYMQEGNANAQINNKANQFNTQQESIADRTNTRALNRHNLMEGNRKRQSIAETGKIAQGVTRDINSADQYDKMIQALSEEYAMVQDENGNIRFKPKKNFT